MAKRRVSKPQRAKPTRITRIIDCPHGIVLMVRCAMQTALNFMDYPHCRRAIFDRQSYSMLNDADKQIAEVEASEVYGWFLKEQPKADPVPQHQHPH